MIQSSRKTHRSFIIREGDPRRCRISSVDTCPRYGEPRTRTITQLPDGAPAGSPPRPRLGAEAREAARNRADARTLLRLGC